jgi:hypothetical protein
VKLEREKEGAQGHILEAKFMKIEGVQETSWKMNPKVKIMYL